MSLVQLGLAATNGPPVFTRYTTVSVPVVAALTTTVNDFVFERAGEPLSVAVTFSVYVPTLLDVGEMVTAPVPFPLSTKLAKAGRPLADNVIGFPFGSVALTSTAIVVPAMTDLLLMEATTGA